MAETMLNEELGELDQVFRPAKRRKQYRRRNDEDDEHTPSVPETSTPQLSTDLYLEKSELPRDDLPEVQASSASLEDISRSELLRQRKLLQRRRGGIEFTNRDESGEKQMIFVERSGRPTEQDEIADEIEKVVNRFAPQTGQIADVNKHMYVILSSAFLAYLIQRLISKDGIHRFRTG